jgi:hypothetical protein
MPEVVSDPDFLEPGHVGSVIGSEPAVLIEVDFEGDTAKHFGLPETHEHA